MSVQETKLRAIANAIRQKDGSSGPIPANDFPARILAIPTGGGGASGGFAVPLTVSVEPGAAVTASNGSESASGIADGTGTVTLILTAPGVWTVTAALDGKEKSVEVEVSEGYSAEIALLSRLPAGYTETAYIESSGTQYIDTGMKRGGSLKLMMDVEPLEDGSASSTTKYFFNSSYLPTSGTKYVLRAVWSNKGVQACMGSYSTIAWSLVSNNTARRRMIIALDTDSKTISVDTEKHTFTNVNYSSYMGNITLLSFENNDSYKMSARLYSCQIYSQGSLARDLVPCVNAGGEAGLYDLANSVFYGNAGSGEFVPGPAV